MDQFIDLCILSGCDYCSSIRGTFFTLLYSSRHVSIFHTFSTYYWVIVFSSFSDVLFLQFVSTGIV